MTAGRRGDHSPSAGGPSTTSAGPAASPGAAHDIRVRSEFGLSTDPGYVRAVEAADDSTSDLLGVLISPAERADIAQRDRLQQLGLQVIPRIEEQPGYAGAWYDQLDGGALHIASTGPDFSPAVRAVIPPGFLVRYDRVRWSLAELTVVADRIGDEMSGRTPIGKLLGRVAAHEPTNTVDVGIRVDAPSDTEGVLRRAYPQPFVHVTHSTGEFYAVADVASPPLSG